MLRIIKDTNSSIDDLAWLHQRGVPVSMTSHPGNASSYKLALWSEGIREILWDITCVIADRNNQPAHLLRGGVATPLLSEERLAAYRENVKNGLRQITAYTRSEKGAFLGRIHTAAMMRCFPGVISTQSALLNAYRDDLRTVFEYLAETIPERIFGRYIFPDGAAVALVPDRKGTTFVAQKGDTSVRIARADLAASFQNVLTELEILLCADCAPNLLGGACYQGSASAHMAVILADYWKTGSCTRYDISGPDMMGYSTTPKYHAELAEILEYVRKQFPSLVPRHVIVRMVPGTVARVGCVRGHISEKIVQERIALLLPHTDKEKKKELRKTLMESHYHWPLHVNQATDAYFSQHDLLSLGGGMFVPDHFRTMPLGEMEAELVRIKNIILRP